MTGTRWTSIFLLVFVCTLWSQTETPPQGAPPKDFKLPEKTSFELTNGLKVTLVPFGEVPKVTVRVRIRVGGLNESADQVWLAALVGEMLKEGTKSRDAAEIAEEAAGMGGTITVSTGDDQTTISGDVLTEYGPALADLLADIVQNPRLPESELERLKRDMLRNLSIQKSQPRSIVREKFRAELFGDHPYGRVFPKEDKLSGYTIDSIQEFYDANFGAKRAHLYVAGRFDERNMQRAIRQSFRSWRSGEEPRIDIPQASSERLIHLIDRPDAAQSTIFIGLPVIDPSHDDHFKLQLTNTLLGGAFTSRIVRNIREDKGYTYSPGSRISNRYRSSFWVQIADVTTEVTGPALREIFYEINRLQDEAPTDVELEKIKNYASGIFVLRNASRSGIINQLSYLNLHGLDESYLTGYVKNVHEISATDIQQMTRQYLKDEEMMIVVAGDSKKIKQQISNYGKIVK